MELLKLVSDFMVNSRLNKLIVLYLKPGVPNITALTPCMYIKLPKIIIDKKLDKMYTNSILTKITTVPYNTIQCNKTQTYFITGQPS